MSLPSTGGSSGPRNKDCSAGWTGFDILPPVKYAAVVFFLALTLAACRSGPPGASGGGTAAAKADALVLPFVQDDYAGALQTARERKLPLFVETWAPW